MSRFEKEYKSNLIKVLGGIEVEGRNGNTVQLSGLQIRADLREGFPLVTSKKIFPKSIAVETEWLLAGRCDLAFLNDRGVKIWNQWALPDGTLGPVYGSQLTNFNGVNQLYDIVDNFKINPNGRRHLLTMWNPADLEDMALPPCHYAWQLLKKGNYVDVIVSMRSLDMFIGLPYDMGMYSMILSSFAKEVGLMPGEVIINAASAHIYTDHIPGVKEYLGNPLHNLSELLEVPTFSNFKSDEVIINKYKSGNRIPVKVHK